MKPLLILPFTLLFCLPVMAQVATEPAPASVRPGINKKYLDPALKVDDWLKSFEVESREVFHARKAVLDVCRVEPGMTVADIGAGTGLYTRLFSEAAGEKGWVYAVDISAPFLQHIQARAKQENQRNISCVLCQEDSISLPPESIDIAFACDTYHHLEYPASTTASLVRALKPGGRLIIIDYVRIEGKSSKWVLGHVRVGEEGVRQEIEQAGLKFDARIEIPALVENYCLRFVKPAR